MIQGGERRVLELLGMFCGLRVTRRATRNYTTGERERKLKRTRRSRDGVSPMSLQGYEVVPTRAQSCETCFSELPPRRRLRSTVQLCGGVCKRAVTDALADSCPHVRDGAGKSPINAGAASRASAAATCRVTRPVLTTGISSNCYRGLVSQRRRGDLSQGYEKSPGPRCGRRGRSR